jgi:hypothetical protein
MRLHRSLGSRATWSRTPTARPDWVVLGTPWQDGKVAILASKHLTAAELELVVEVDDDIMLADPDPLWLERRRCTLTVEMPTFTLIVADTYEQAFRALFDEWSPEPDTLALPPGEGEV